MNETPKHKKERAARLVAEAEYEFAEIAEMIGVTVRTLHNWRKDEKFSARVNALARDAESDALKRAIARKSYRIRVLANLHRAFLTVIDERKSDPDLLKVSKTGMVVRKAVVSGGEVVGYEYVADTALAKELRGIQEQAAKELGQFVEKHEHKIRSLKDLSEDEVDALIAELEGSEPDAPGGAEKEEGGIPEE